MNNKWLLGIILSVFLFGNAAYSVESNKGRKPRTTASAGNVISGGAAVKFKEGKLVISISGAAAEKVYSSLEVEPAAGEFGSAVKVGKNLRCIENGDETTCTIVINDNGKQGEISLHGN